MMMKVLIAHMNAECNEHIQHTVDLEEFDIRYGSECSKAMHIDDIFAQENIELIPAIYANLHPNGMIKKEAFDHILTTILNCVKAHMHEIDGIYLHLHGASGVLGLEEVSGEHVIVKRIRAMVGRYMPIAVVMDPHGNLTKEFCDNVNIVRCYRESPHSDAIATKRKVAYLLIDLLKNRRPMKPIIRKIPIMVGGERSVSAMEPMRTINKLLDEAEKDPRVFSCSYHVGYIRHDDDKLGAAVVFIPDQPNDKEYCENQADLLAKYVWDHRHEFKFSGNYAEVDDAVAKILACHTKTAVLTDSGDNCGAGGAGENTIVLKEILKHPTNKKILFAGINDESCYQQLSQAKLNEHLEISLGIGRDLNSETIKLQVTLVGKGKQMYASHKFIGDAYIIRIDDTMIDVIVLNHILQYGTMDQFLAAGVDFHDYDIVIVKMGYLDTELIPETSYHIMALTDGPTIQRSERIPFKKIYRPMWPIDKIEELIYIE